MKRKHFKNVAGIVAGFCLIIFGVVFTLWQLDLIVSGPVWWTDGSQGWKWYGPGAYAEASFQCFVIQTTVGRAYDTLFLLNFLFPVVGGVIVFLSLWFWEDEP